MTLARLAALTALLLAPLSLAQPAAPAPLTHWGRYTLQFTPRPSPDDGTGTARLTLRDGTRTVLTVSEWDVQAELQPLRPGGQPELVVTAYSGGAHCCFTYLMYTQDQGALENLGVLNGTNYGARFADLNGDGTREIIVGLDNLAYYDWSFAGSPGMQAVLGWDGVRLADRTRAYPYVPAQEAARNLERLRNNLADPTLEGLEGLAASASGYLDNMLLAGRGVEAERLLQTQIFPKSPALQRWFAAHRGDVIGAIYGQPEARLSILTGPVWPPKKTTP
ncbi:hypothetical protein [Deinococcus sonorensis]|uniref:VCBS repeat-containing protein n=2 Tax=Deinococcus sonorensis TaxID=309891 RepID=A0AAU7U981_9DEIO